MQCRELEDRAGTVVVVQNSGADTGRNIGNDMSDKKNWMSSVQLWSTNDINSDSKQHDSKSETKQVNRNY